MAAVRVVVGLACSLVVAGQGSPCAGPQCPAVSCAGSAGAAPCVNGGRCRTGAEAAAGVTGVCVCPDGYNGHSCQHAAVECGGGRWCTNGGACPDGAGFCVCPDGFSGAHCQEEDPAPVVCDAGHACENGGTCAPDSSTSTEMCDCPPGFHGGRCQFRGVECGGGRWCTNGGACPDGAGFCVCPEGFAGAHCQTDLGLNGDSTVVPGSGGDDDGDGVPDWVIWVSLTVVVVVVALLGLVCVLIAKERKGEPLFSPLEEEVENKGAASGSAPVELRPMHHQAFPRVVSSA